MFRVLFICSEHFLTIIMGNSKNMSENNVWMKKKSSCVGL